MTIPMLTAQLSEPAKSQTASGKPRAETRAAESGRNDDRDFAAAMSESAHDARKDTGKAKSASESQAGADRKGADADAKPSTASPGDRDAKPDVEMAAPDDSGAVADIADTALPNAPKRRVTIPELPPKRGAADPGSLGTHTPEATPSTDLDVSTSPANSEHARLSELRLPAQAAQTGTPRGGLAPASTAIPAKMAQFEMAARPAASEVAVDEQAIATAKTAKTVGTAGADLPHDRSTAPTDARHAPLGNPVARSGRATPLSRAEIEVPAEDRATRRNGDALTRAIETAAATPAPAPTPSAVMAQASVSARMSVLQPATRDALNTKEKAEALLSLEGETESLRFDMRGSSGSTGTQPGSFAAALTRADLPRSIAMQIGDMVRAMPDKPVDVSLSPEELGRVRLSISAGEGGVTLNVLAERPETLDLMRRHADMLARELADLGFASIDLSFGKGNDHESGDGEGGSGDGKGHAGRKDDEIDAVSTPDRPVNRLTLGPNGGLDIRI